jgi:hypothetical protein
MTVSGGRFGLEDGQFTVTGTIDGSSAHGTVRDDTGDCDTGTLSWST